MATPYAITIGHAADPDTPAAPEESATDAATPADAWRDWLESAHAELAADAEDVDDIDLVAVALAHAVGGGPDAVAARDERIEEVSRATQIVTGQTTIIRQRQRDAREERATEMRALDDRLTRMNNLIEETKRESADLRRQLTACEKNLEAAAASLRREIAKERSLRRLLDAQRNRPHTQRVASELARIHAEKVTKRSVNEAEEEAA